MNGILSTEDLNRRLSKAIFWFILFFPVSNPALAQSDGHNTITIQRTTFGVPHIKSNTLFGSTFGLAYCQLEDYGAPVISRLVGAQGKLAFVYGLDAVESDMISRQVHEVVEERYNSLSGETRSLLEGFAAGINHFMQQHPDSFSLYSQFRFTGIDVAAASTFITTPPRGLRILDKMKAHQAIQDSLKALEDTGSNTWAFGPEKTKSGHPILMRNPHLSWTAGYYEAHLIVPGKLNFYGDFRIGGLFGIIGGFNDRLGWSTTNNNPDTDEFYELSVDTQKPDHYLLDHQSHPIIRKEITIEFKNGDGLGLVKQEYLSTPFGPVIARENGKIYVLKRAGHFELRRAEQFTRMMLSQNLVQWKDAMRMQAITSSNYTYADADGNIFYVWNGTIPKLPIPSGGDSTAISVNSAKEIWSEFIPFDKLPQLHNPQGGYLHNENDPFHFTNLNEVIQPSDHPDYFVKPRLRPRSQHSLNLIHNNQKLSLEEVVTLKHSLRMEVAYILKDDLLHALSEYRPKRKVKRGIQLLESWDNSVHADSKGGLLFAEWFNIYRRKTGNQFIYETPWQFDNPMSTPDGLGNKEIALDAFLEAMKSLEQKFGSFELAWGDVHRIRYGGMDLPASGGPSVLGCFRVLGFTEDADGKRKVYRGDGWQFAVEFSNPVKAYSILAYGQSDNPRSAHHTDQLQLFADNQMKRIAFSDQEISDNLIDEYSIVIR